MLELPGKVKKMVSNPETELYSTEQPQWEPEEKRVTLLPFFLRMNRGGDGAMRVWLKKLASGLLNVTAREGLRANKYGKLPLGREISLLISRLGFFFLPNSPISAHPIAGLNLKPKENAYNALTTCK